MNAIRYTGDNQPWNGNELIRMVAGILLDTIKSIL